MLLRRVARMGLSQNSRALIHSSRICGQHAEEEQTVIKKAAEGDPRPLYLDAQSTTPLDPRVLDAMLPYLTSFYGNPHSRTHSSIRFGISRFTTEEEVDYTAERCIKEVQRLREMSPLWEMYEDGIDIKSIQWSQH